MGAKVKNDKNSLVLLSSKRTKADTRTRADEAFALPSFPEATPMYQMELPSRSCKEVAMDHHTENDLEKLKQTMLQHEAMFREQVRELHRLYQVQRLLMAEVKKKDSSIHTSSGPPSSNSSLVYSSDSFKPGGERNLWEAIGASRLSSRQGHQAFVSRSEQISQSQIQIHVSKSQEAIQHPEEFVNSKYQKVVRRTFDLERPAEEYMDVEEDAKYMDGDISLKVTPTSNVTQLGRAPFDQNLVPGKDIHLSLRTGCEREIVDTVHRELHERNVKSSKENGRQTYFLSEHSGCTEISFFSTIPSRMDCPSQEALVRPTPVLSTKSLLGGLLGQPRENHSEDKLIPGSQRRHLDEQGGKKQERQSEAEDRSTRENINQPHWLLQGPAPLMKTLPGNPSSQNSGWQQPVPSFLQKQNELDRPNKLSFVPVETGRPTVSQESSKLGNTWFGGQSSLHQGQIFAMGSQCNPSTGFPLNGTTGQGSYKTSQQVGESINQANPVPPVRDERGARLLPLIKSDCPPVSAVDMQPPVLEAHATPMMFLPGLSSIGTAHGTAIPPWFQQNGLFSFMQQQQATKPGSLSLGQQRTLLVPPHVGSVAAQPPAGDYEVQVANTLGFNNDLGGNIHGMFKATDDTNYSFVHSAPVVKGPEMSFKRSAIGSMPMTAGIELTLGLGSQLNKISESLARDEDSSCFGETPQQDKHTGLPFMRDGFDVKALRGNRQPIQNNMLYSKACYAEEVKSGGFEDFLKQEARTIKINDSHDASSIKAPHAKELQVLQAGLNQTASSFAQRGGKEGTPFDVLKIKPVLCQQRMDESHVPLMSKVTEGQRQVFQKDPGDCIEQLSVNFASGIVPLHGEVNSVSSRKEVAVNQDGQMIVNGADRPFRFGKAGSSIVGKSSDLATLTSCVVRETHNVPLQFCKDRNNSNTGGGEACQSSESGVVHSQCENLVTALSSNMHSSIIVGKLQDLNISPIMRSSSAVFHSDTVSDMLNAGCLDHDENTGSEDSNKRVDDHSKQAADILVSLASDLTSILGGGVTEDNAVFTQETSLEWFASIIPGEEECEALLRDGDAACSVQVPQTSEGKKSFEESREDTSGNPERGKEARPKEAQSPKELDFFESVTLMLKASDFDADTLNSRVIERWQVAGEGQSFSSHRGRSSRRGRGRVGRDFQREMLPSIASLSRQEITEDLQTIGGLMKSATEMVARRTASSMSLKEDGSSSPTGLGMVRKNSGTKGNGANTVSKPCSRKDEMEDPNGFLRICSWGESTRRRRMRRHRSRWSLLPLVGTSSP